MFRFLLAGLFCLVGYFSFGQSQSEMNTEAARVYQKADKELNGVYQKVLADYKKDPAFIKNLKAAQKLWIQFRDAEMKAKYPDREKGYYGSSQPMCWYIHLTELTQERTKKLKVWLTGIKDGDECSGTVKNYNTKKY